MADLPIGSDEGADVVEIIQSSTLNKLAIDSSGRPTVNQGAPNSAVNKWPVMIVDTAGVNIATVTGTGAVKVDGSAVTQPISAVALPLPTGAATDASLAIINANLTNGNQIVKGMPASVGQKTMANSLPVVIASDQSAVPTNLNGLAASKTKVMKTGSIATTATTADQVVLTYTVTAGKTFFLEYYVGSAHFSTQPGNANPVILGNMSLESPAGTKLITDDRFHPNTNIDEVYTFSDPIAIAAGTVIRVVCTPAAATNYTWRSNFGGYEL